MNREQALIQLRAQLLLDDSQDFWHSAPLFGREHVSDPSCWCHPKQDHIEPRIWVHTPSH